MALPEVMFDTVYPKSWPPLVSKIEQITLDKKKKHSSSKSTK